MLNRHSIELGKRRGDAHRLFSPARWMDCVPAGRHAPTSSDYLKISTWNVRSLYLAGKLSNIAKEMIRMNIDVLGVSETFWKDRGNCRYHLPNNEDFRVIFAGGNEHRKGVAFVMRGIAMDSIINYSLKSERIIIVRLLSKPKKLLLCQIYAPTATDSDEEIEKFYEVENAIIETKKWDDIVIAMGISTGKENKVKW